MDATNVQMFQPIQKQSYIKGNTISSSGGFDNILKQSFMLQRTPTSESLNKQNIRNVKQLLNDDKISVDDVRGFVKGFLDVLNSEEGNDLLEQFLSDNQDSLNDLADWLEFLLNNEHMVLNDLSKTQFAELFQQLQNVLIKRDSELMELEGLSNSEVLQLVTVLHSVIDKTEEDNISELEIEDIIHENITELNELTESKIIQLFTQIQSVMNFMNRGESPEKIARMFLPLLNEWTSMSKQHSKETLNQFATKFLIPEDVEILKNVQELYEKRTHFQSKQMYRENATVTSSDVAQWIKAALNQNQDYEQTHRVISTLNNEPITVPRISVVNQQAIHQLDSVQRIDAEMSTKIANIIKQHMLLQNRGPMQSLSMVLTPEHLGRLQVNFSQVDGEMIVRIIASSSYAKEMLESNLHQLKHAFSPHQVQVVRGDDTLIEDDVLPQQEEQNEEQQETHDEQQEEQNEEQITINFSTLFEEALEEEEVMIND